MVITILLMQVVVIFVYVRDCMSDEVFLIWIRTFLEKFYLLGSLVSYLGVYHSRLHKNVYYSLVKILVNARYLSLVGEVFHQGFLCFSKTLPGYKNFQSCGFSSGDLCVYLISCFHVKNFFVFDKNF